MDKSISLRVAKIAFGYIYPDGFIQKNDNPRGNGYGQHTTTVQFEKDGRCFVYRRTLRGTLASILGLQVEAFEGSFNAYEKYMRETRLQAVNV